MRPTGLPPELRDLVPPAEEHSGALPDDLAVLGDRLEVAAQRTMARRTALRRTASNAVLTVLLGVPLALAAAATDVAPSSAPVERVARTGAAPPPTTDRSNAYLIQHLPDLTLAAAAGRACVGDPDCRAPEHPSPVPARLRTLY